MKKRIQRKTITSVLILLLLFSLSACGQKQDDPQPEPDAQAQDGGNAAGYPLTITDDLGDSVTIEEAPEAIVSLSPTNTEIIFAIGAQDLLKGRTDSCNYPQEAQDIESIGSFAEPNAEKIVSLSPDVVFASEYIDDGIRQQIEAAGGKIVVFSADSIDGVVKDIQTVGQIAGMTQEAKAITDKMEEKYQDLKEITSKVEKPKSVFLDLGGFYSAGDGSFLDNLLQDLNIQNIAAGTGNPWPQLSVEQIVAANPDVYLSFYTTPEELKSTSGISDLPAIQNDAIVYYKADSTESDMTQRSGPRIVDGLELLAKAIYPEAFSEK